MRIHGGTMLWAAAAAVVTVGWGSGYVVWTPASSDEFGSYFDVYVPAITLLVGLPLALTSGFLLSRQGWARRLGYAMFALTVVSLTYMAQFAFFGGFCLDPGEDVCVTTWPSRLAALATAVLCVAAGWLVHRLASHRRPGVI